MLELRLWSFGNPFSHRQGDHLGTNSSLVRVAPTHCRNAQKGFLEKGAVFPWQREKACCTAALQ